MAGYGYIGSLSLSLTGDGGIAIDAGLNIPQHLALDNNDNLYIADSGNNEVRKVNLLTGIISDFAGNGTTCQGGGCGDGGAAIGAELNNPTGVVVGASGSVYIADQGDNKIRVVNAAGNISTFAGTGSAGFGGDGGSALSASFNQPAGIAIDPAGAYLYVADLANHRIRQILLSGSHTVQTVVNQAPGTAGYSEDGSSAYDAQLHAPHDVAFDAQGNLYIADTVNNAIREVSIASGQIGNINTIAGKPTSPAGFSGDSNRAVNALLNTPWAVAVDPGGQRVYRGYHQPAPARGAGRQLHHQYDRRQRATSSGLLWRWRPSGERGGRRSLGCGDRHQRKYLCHRPG